jgi:hypothetical protein
MHNGDVDRAMLMIGGKPSERLKLLIEDRKSIMFTEYYSFESTAFIQEGDRIYAGTALLYGNINQKIHYNIELHYERGNWKLVDVEIVGSTP